MTARRCLNTLTLCVSIGFSTCCALPDEPKKDEIQLDVPKGWRGERIVLPPGFAKDMKVKGIEEIRFAPGMFQPEAKDFFSYVIVFRLDGKPDLTVESLNAELLTYYRGLAKAVGRGQIKTEGFSIEVVPIKDDQKPTVDDYVAALKWVEPFKTKKEQALRIEIRSWQSAKDRRTWVFMNVSPNKPDDAIWKTMRGVRERFLEQNAKGEPGSS
jgi:hypothetical protein